MKLLTILNMTIAFYLSTQSTFAQDISGKWRTVDDKSGFSRGDVLIRKNEDGTFSGKIIMIRPVPGMKSTGICHNCKGELKDKPLVNMEILSNFTQNPKNDNEYLNGKVLDPLSGNIYKGKIKLIGGGKSLIVRGYLGTSLLGRNQTWRRVE